MAMDDWKDNAWRRMALNANSRIPLDGSRIVFVSVDDRGLDYPKYYTRIDTGLPGDTDLERLMARLEDGEEVEVEWLGNVTGSVQLVGPGWNDGDPLLFGSELLQCVLGVVPDEVLREHGYDPDELRRMDDDEGGDAVRGEEFDLSYWDPVRTPQSILPRLAAMGIPVEQWWPPGGVGWRDLFEVPRFMHLLEASGCGQVVLHAEGDLWFPNTDAGRARISRHLVYGEIAEASSDGDTVEAEVVPRSAESLYRNAYGGHLRCYRAIGLRCRSFFSDPLWQPVIVPVDDVLTSTSPSTIRDPDALLVRSPDCNIRDVTFVDARHPHARSDDSGVEVRVRGLPDLVCGLCSENLRK